MNRAGVNNKVNLITLPLNVGAERTGPQVGQKLLDDVMKPVPINKAVLQMKEQNPIDRTGHKNRNSLGLVLTDLASAATHLIDVDQGLATVYERLHDLCIHFFNFSKPILLLQIRPGFSYIFITVSHLAQMPRNY